MLRHGLKVVWLRLDLLRLDLLRLLGLKQVLLGLVVVWSMSAGFQRVLWLVDDRKSFRL